MREAVVAVAMCPPVPGSLLFSERLRPRFPVRMETRPVALLPGRSQLCAADVPIGAAALQHRAQIEAQLLDRWPAEEPVAVVDLVGTQARLPHHPLTHHRL